jgi:hypothetical protein
LQPTVKGDPDLQRNRQLQRLEQAVERFKGCIQALPDKLFLEPMAGWSPRDVVAHLIGWNRYTVEGCQQILDGQKPFYFDDASSDFSNVNAVSVQRYSSISRSDLLEELDGSFQQLKTYLLSLDAPQWKADRGVRHGLWTITVANTVGALSDDYDAHREEIKQWASSIAGHP